MITMQGEAVQCEAYTAENAQMRLAKQGVGLLLQRLGRAAGVPSTRSFLVISYIMLRRATGYNHVVI